MSDICYQVKILFESKYEQEYSFLKSKENPSLYVAELIKQDRIREENMTQLSSEMIESIVYKVLNKNGLVEDNPKFEKEEKEPEVDPLVIQSAMSLFD